MHDVKRIKTSI